MKKAASAILNLTERGSLSWQEFRPDAAELPDDLSAVAESSVFVALHDGMDLYLYQQADSSEDGEQKTPRLEVADPEAETGWQFPEIEVIEDLYEFVDFRASGLEDWMDQVIEDADADLGVAEAPSSEEGGSGEGEPAEESFTQQGQGEDDAENDSPDEDGGEGEPASEEETTAEAVEDPVSEDIPDDSAEEGAQDVFTHDEDVAGSEEDGIGEDRIL